MRRITNAVLLCASARIFQEEISTHLCRPMPALIPMPCMTTRHGAITSAYQYRRGVTRRYIIFLMAVVVVLHQLLRYEDRDQRTFGGWTTGDIDAKLLSCWLLADEMQSVIKQPCVVWWQGRNFILSTTLLTH